MGIGKKTQFSVRRKLLIQTDPLQLCINCRIFRFSKHIQNSNVGFGCYQSSLFGISSRMIVEFTKFDCNPRPKGFFLWGGGEGVVFGCFFFICCLVLFHKYIHIRIYIGVWKIHFHLACVMIRLFYSLYLQIFSWSCTNISWW